jgi:segregation and condensation protein A
MYKIKLQNFEGPLDLLLFFVRKDELNIYDIPIARITKSYLEYLQLMQDLNLDVAGEFILMAATLMRIKAKSMLPPDPTDDEEEMMDPREELSRRLVEYRQFKEASKTLSEMDEYWRTVYRRSYFNFDLLPPNQEEAVGLKDISFFDLLAAYKNALAKRPKTIFHNIERINVTVEDQQKYIAAFFRDRTCYLFTELCEDMGKIEILVTFLAMLDLIRKGEIAVKQASIFDDIWIYKAEEFKEEEIPEAERAVPIEDMTAEIQGMTEPMTTAETQAMAEITAEYNADEMSLEQETEEIESKDIVLPGAGQNSGKADVISDTDHLGSMDETSGTLDSHSSIAEKFTEKGSIGASETGESEPVSGDTELAMTGGDSLGVTADISEVRADPDTLESDSSLSELHTQVDSSQLTDARPSEDGIAEDEITSFSGHDQTGSSGNGFVSSDSRTDIGLEEPESSMSLKSDSTAKNEEVTIAPIKEVIVPAKMPAASATPDELGQQVMPAEKISRFKSFINKIVSIVKKLFS